MTLKTAWVVVLVAALASAGCERTGRKIDNAAAKTGQAAKKAAKKTGEVAKKASDKIFK